MGVLQVMKGLFTVTSADVSMKILLLDDHALFRAGLRLLLEVLHPATVILESGTIQEALTIVGVHTDINLCLLDLHLHHENGLEMIAQLKTIVPDTVVVVVSSNDDQAIIRACLDAGAMSFIPKTATPDELAEALRFVLAGAIYLPTQILATAESPQPPSVTLSPRQQDVLRCLCQGLSTKSIARQLALSDQTVKKYIDAIFKLLQVHNRTEAVIQAGKQQLLVDRR